MNGQNYNAIVTEYLQRTQGFDKENDIYLLPRTEVSHSCLANNFKMKNKNIYALEMSTGEGIKRPNIYGGFEAVIYRRNGYIYIIVNDQSGHYQTKQKTLLGLLKSLLEAKGYGVFVILIPPRDKPHYRTYITNDPHITRDERPRKVKAPAFKEKDYVKARIQMQQANTDPTILPQNQIRRAISVKEPPKQSQRQEVVMEEDDT
jgi:hypothetical protein